MGGETGFECLRRDRTESRNSDNSVEKFGSRGESRAITREETEIQVESIFK